MTQNETQRAMNGLLRRLEICERQFALMQEAIQDAHQAATDLELSLQGQADLALVAVESDQDRPGGAPQVDGAAGMQG